MKKNIFISRHLKPGSIFRKLLTEQGYALHGESLIQFSTVPFDSFPHTDWIFFYSRQGVRHFFSQVSPAQLVKVRLAAIGPGTARMLEETFRAADFTGDGDANSTAAGFLTVARGQSVLFARARDSRRSVQLRIAGETEVFELVVYDNQPREDFDLPVFDGLVFTSPLNVKAYFSKKKYREGQIIVAIGNPTARALKAEGLEKVIISDAPSEEALARAVLENMPAS